MAPRNQLQLEPTFPLDGKEIQRRIRQSMVKTLSAFGVVGALVTLGLTLGLSTTGFLIGLAGTFYGLRRFYWHSLKRVEAEVINNMIHEHNSSQDLQLERVVAGLRERGFHAYAAALGKFILVKQRIESSLHQGRFLSASNEELDNLVDRICSLTCDHLSRLSALDLRVGEALTRDDAGLLQRLEHERTQILVHVQRAYCTMYECLDNLLDYAFTTTGVAASSAETRPDALSGMGQAIQQLEQENQTLRNIMGRMEGREPVPPPPIEIYGEPGEEEKVRADSRRAERREE